MDAPQDWQVTSDGVELAMAHLMPKSAGAVVREAFYGVTRFDDFLRRTKLPRSVLTTQLDRLVSLDLLHKVPYQDPGQRARQAYELTAKGREMGIALVALMDWARRWRGDQPAVTVAPTHIGCGAVVHAALRCAAGHTDLDIGDVHAAYTGAHRGGPSSP